MAEALLDLTNGELPTSTHIPLYGYDEVHALLLDIKDMLTLQVTGGGKKFKPSPRPETALQVVRNERKNRKLSSLADRLTNN